MNWGMRLLITFVSAWVPCVCPYFCPSVATCVSPAAVLKMFSTPLPLPQLVLYSFTVLGACMVLGADNYLRCIVLGAVSYLNYIVLLEQLVT